MGEVVPKLGRCTGRWVVWRLFYGGFGRCERRGEWGVSGEFGVFVRTPGRGVLVTLSGVRWGRRSGERGDVADLGMFWECLRGRRIASSGLGSLSVCSVVVWEILGDEGGFFGL